MDGEQLVELLQHRHGLLGELIDRPRPRHELVDAVESSKSTVYKGLSQLEEAGLIDQRSEDRRLTPTLFGVLALTRYDSLVETAGVADLLVGLPGSAVAPGALVGAEVVRPDETDAERHLEALWSLLEGTEGVRGVAPVVSPGYVERFREFLETGAEAELVLPESVLRALQQDRPDAIETISRRTDLYGTSDAMPFGVLVTRGDRPRMAIELRDGPLVAGLIVNDTPDALVWGEATYETYRTSASRLDPGEGSAP
jgi:predicted transcriptional regulator